MIVILSLGISVGTAVASLVFLVLIHKLEYLINSRIVGGETDSQAWEILHGHPRSARPPSASAAW